MQTPKTLHDIQRLFVASMYNTASEPELLSLIANGEQAALRLAVYQNNVHSTLKQTLQNIYPIMVRLGGCDFFSYLALDFIRKHPAKYGNLDQYGIQFSEFLRSHPAVQDYLYMADVAALEWAIQESHFAEDTPAATHLAPLPEETYALLRFNFHPSVHILSSPFPLYRIWEVHQPQYVQVPEVDLSSGPSFILVHRPAYTVEVTPLTPGEHVFLHTLYTGEPLRVAYENALPYLSDDATLAVANLLQRYISSRTLSGVIPQ